MEDFILHLDKRLAESEFERVHAVLVTADGRVLVRYKNGEPRITGGHIDLEDADLASALRREIKEEINCEIDRCDYLGYLEVEKQKSCEENGSEVNDLAGSEKWARMVARVSVIGEAKPDPDRENNWIYGRELLTYEEALKAMCDPQKVGKFAENNAKFLPKAYKVAEVQGYFTEEESRQNEVLNLEAVGGEVVPKI